MGIDANKLVRDLIGIKEVLLAQGDPFLAMILNRAIMCVENQPTVETAGRKSNG